ncbi:helix-turn-helix domain-containing protein [Sphingomonas sp.]|uniref:TetR/AcrR family transcriptional regulator n=1 Tax=Sphingomonas sp. TaxID=28214 RepID=UPI001B227EED|nr:helix-turn-helix domain-containing protein [Sphingomonas sp.]MBO9714284.1 helix-turn-helix transcriptional regulator [Sphingomonas sp.]
MSITRKRLSPEESRDAAIEAARELLLEAGPQAVTLKAVAAKIGRTHANLLHHFGSAAGLQKALAQSITGSVRDRIADAVLRTRARGDHDPREVVDLTFDVFGKGGAGALASWMILTGNQEALAPILESIRGLVDMIGKDHPHNGTALEEETLHLVLLALGDALLGEPMVKALGLKRDAARGLATQALMAPHLHAEDGEG